MIGRELFVKWTHSSTAMFQGGLLAAHTLMAEDDQFHTLRSLE